MRNEAFTCSNCHREVLPHPTGSARNHCPYCLTSLHVDAEFPGDRASNCRGSMLAIDLTQKKHKGMVILHHCSNCGKEITNIPAPDDEIGEFMMRLPEIKLKREKGRKAVDIRTF